VELIYCTRTCKEEFTRGVVGAIFAIYTRKTVFFFLPTKNTISFSERGKTDSGQIWYVKRQQGVPSPGAGSWLQDRKTRQIIVQAGPPGLRAH
jgi:hypothetical protein